MSDTPSEKPPQARVAWTETFPPSNTADHAARRMPAAAAGERVVAVVVRGPDGTERTIPCA